MRAEVFIAAAMLASAGTASAGGYGGHAAGHAASVATASASAHAAAYATAHGSSRSFVGPRGLQRYGYGYGYGYAPRGPSSRGYQPGGYGYDARGYGRYGSGNSGYGGAGLGLYAGYGLGDALQTDASGYDYEGSPQPYGPPDYPPPPYLAPAGYGPGFGYGRGAPEATDRVHVSGEGVYAYGYYGHSETPELPYDALPGDGVTAYGQGEWAPPPAGMASGYPGLSYGSACGC